MSGDLKNISYDTLFTSRDDEDFLGEGGFSTVFRCYSHSYGDLAIKIMSASGRSNEFDEEGKMHLQASVCEHILRVIGITQRMGFLGLVLEYMPYGSLAERIKEKKLDLPWTFRLRAMQETASALAFLHNLSENKRVLHCDIKTDNILLNQDLHVKVSDFGGAKFANYTSFTVERSRRAGQHGQHKEKMHCTLSHAAPEIFKDGDTDRTSKMDVYSYAIVLYTVASRMVPFANIISDLISFQVQQGQRPMAGLDKVKKELEQAGNQYNLEIFQLFCHLMKKCWDAVPNNRLNMIQVRDSMTRKLQTVPKNVIDVEILQLKQNLKPYATIGMPQDPITVYAKYCQMRNETMPSSLSSRNQELPELQRQVENISLDVRHPNEQQIYSSSEQDSPLPSQDDNISTTLPQTTASTSPTSSNPPRSPSSPQQKPEVVESTTVPKGTRPKEFQRPPIRRLPSKYQEKLQELEQGFIDPYFRLGNPVRMISDIAAIKNAQVGHGGWNDSLLDLRDMEGRVVKVETNGDVMVSFSGLRSHRFNPSSLVKIPGGNTLKVGDVVKIELDKNLVEVMQEGHGGWVDMMESLFGELGLVFRFLNDKDVLVVYKNGSHFRYNPEVLCKATESEEMREICLPDNPGIRVGDYVCHDLDDDVMKEMQESCGGWNEMMSDLRGRVGKFIYADYSGRAFMAYSSKICFVFNPAVITKLSDEEAYQRFQIYQEKSALVRKEKTEQQNSEQKRRFQVNDLVRVHLPLDTVVELQRGHGGWSHQMLEVYGLQGVIKGFDNHNVQVLFDTGTKWTFNPAALQIVPDDDSPPAYKPPFRIGDRVRVELEELTNQNIFDENKKIHAFKMLGIPDDKVELLMRTGTVMGIDDDLDVIVCFDEDDKNYGFKPHQLQKITND